VIDDPTVNSPAEKGGAPSHPTMSMIDITKRYNAIAALTDVSFDVLPGEVHALLGENGAGKSTLMNVASGTTAPDAGTIIFDGSPVENLTPAMAQDLGWSLRQVQLALQRAGTTPRELIREERLRLVRDRLRNPLDRNVTITDLAHATGFSSASALSHAFRQRFGVSPRELRRHGASR